MTTMRAKPPLPSPIAARSGSSPIESDVGSRIRDTGARDIAASSPTARIEIRWCCTASACASHFEVPLEQLAIHELAELIVTLTTTDNDHGQLEAQLVLGEHRRTTIAPKSVALITHEHDQWRHLDALLDDRTILQLSWCGRELRYAQTTLLADAGLPGGNYDRPRVMILAHDNESHEAAICRLDSRTGFGPVLESA